MQNNQIDIIEDYYGYQTKILKSCRSLRRTQLSLQKNKFYNCLKDKNVFNKGKIKIEENQRNIYQSQQITYGSNWKDNKIFSIKINEKSKKQRCKSPKTQKFVYDFENKKNLMNVQFTISKIKLSSYSNKNQEKSNNIKCKNQIPTIFSEKQKIYVSYNDLMEEFNKNKKLKLNNNSFKKSLQKQINYTKLQQSQYKLQKDLKCQNKTQNQYFTGLQNQKHGNLKHRQYNNEIIKNSSNNQSKIYSLNNQKANNYVTKKQQSMAIQVNIIQNVSKSLSSHLKNNTSQNNNLFIIPYRSSKISDRSQSQQYLRGNFHKKTKSYKNINNNMNNINDSKQQNSQSLLNSYRQFQSRSSRLFLTRNNFNSNSQNHIKLINDKRITLSKIHQKKNGLYNNLYNNLYNIHNVVHDQNQLQNQMNQYENYNYKTPVKNKLSKESIDLELKQRKKYLTQYYDKKAGKDFDVVMSKLKSSDVRSEKSVEFCGNQNSESSKQSQKIQRIKQQNNKIIINEINQQDTNQKNMKQKIKPTLKLIIPFKIKPTLRTQIQTKQQQNELKNNLEVKKQYPLNVQIVNQGLIKQISKLSEKKQSSMSVTFSKPKNSSQQLFSKQSNQISQQAIIIGQSSNQMESKIQKQKQDISYKNNELQQQQQYFSQSSQSLQLSQNLQKNKISNISLSNDNLSSKQQSLISKKLKSIVTIKQQNPPLRPLSLNTSTIDDIIVYIEQHELMIGFLYLFIDNTKNYYLQNEQNVKMSKDNKIMKFLQEQHDKKMKKYQEKMQRLNFLILKKYLYEKNRMIKCLKGLQPNIFILSGIQIPSQILQKHINHQRIKQKIIQTSSQTKQLFKQLNESYRQLRSDNFNYKSDKLIKIQAPYDNFSKQIVIVLYQQLNQLVDQIDRLTGQAESQVSEILQNTKSNLKGNSNNNRESVTSINQLIAEQIAISQQRCLQIMEIIFLLSNLQQRKVKKLQMFNLLDLDFYNYFQSNYHKVQQIYQYFRNIKYSN